MIIYNSFARKVFLTSDVSYSQIGLIHFPYHLLEVTRTDVDNLPKQFCVGRRSKVKLPSALSVEKRSDFEYCEIDHYM